MATNDNDGDVREIIVEEGAIASATQQRELPDEEAIHVADLAWGKGFDEFTRDWCSWFKVVPLRDGVVLRFMDPPRLSDDDAQHRPHSTCFEIVLQPRTAMEFVIAMGDALRKAYGPKDVEK